MQRTPHVAPRAAVLVAALLAILRSPVFAEDSITITSGFSGTGSTAQVPVYLRDISGTPLGRDMGTNRIQGVGFKVSYSPASAVTAISFARAGILQALTPGYERSIPSTNALGYVAWFPVATAPVLLTLDAPAPGDRIGTLSVTFSGAAPAGTVVTLTIDSTSAMLGNEAGTIGETVALGTLALVNGTAAPGGETATMLGSSSNPSTVGQNVTFTATVTSPDGGPISGNVTFKDGATTLGTIALSANQAIFSTSALAQGTHSITATYNGNGTLGASAAGLSQVVNAATFSAPTGLTATASSPTSVTVSWFPVTGADHYEVWRSSNNQPFALIASPTAATLNDSPVSSNTTYLYQVRAVNASAVASPFSAIDAATTILFTDDPLTIEVTAIKAVHVNELRDAVNAYRAAAGLSLLTFSEAVLPDVVVRASHVLELRSGLNAARSALSQAAINFADSTLTAGTTKIKAIHLQELRDWLK